MSIERLSCWQSVLPRNYVLIFGLDSKISTEKVEQNNKIIACFIFKNSGNFLFSKISGISKSCRWSQACNDWLWTVPLNFRTFTVLSSHRFIFMCSGIVSLSSKSNYMNELKRNISFAFGEHEPSSSSRYILKCVTRLFVSACNKMQIFSRRLLAFLLLTFIMHFLNCWNPQFTAIIFARTEAMLAKENASLCRLQLYRNRNCQFHVRHIYENVCVISV